MLQGTTLDRSGAFRSANQAPCTVWPRTVMRGELRKGNSGHNSVPKSARRTEPSPRNPRFAAHLRCVSAKEGLGESRGGKGTIRCPCPLLPPPPGGGIPAGEHRHLRPPKAANSPLPWERHLRRQTAASSQNPAAGSGSTQIPRVFFNFPCLQLTFSIFHGILNYRKQKEPMPASISSLINGIRHLVLPTPAGGKISQP